MGRISTGLQDDYGSVMKRLRDLLGEETFEREWSEGKDASLDSIVEEII